MPETVAVCDTDRSNAAQTLEQVYAYEIELASGSAALSASNPPINITTRDYRYHYGLLG